MPDSPDRLRTLARRTGFCLYCFAVITLGLAVQVFTNGVDRYAGTIQVLFMLGIGLSGIFLPMTMILMGSQLRAAARECASRPHSPPS